MSVQADPVVIESASQHLQRVKLQEQPGVPIKSSATSGRRAGPAPHETAFSPGTTSALLQGDSVDALNDHAESKMRECFSEAFDKEVEYLASLNVAVTKERKRQILADILVWAEVTQQHYDTTTRSFVLEPNQHDESFLRVGRFLLDAKRHRSLL